MVRVRRECSCSSLHRSGLICGFDLPRTSAEEVVRLSVEVAQPVTFDHDTEKLFRTSPVRQYTSYYIHMIFNAPVYISFSNTSSAIQAQVLVLSTGVFI
jgi:hypothetical protein